MRFSDISSMPGVPWSVFYQDVLTVPVLATDISERLRRDGMVRIEPTYPYCIADEFTMPIQIETGIPIPAKRSYKKKFCESEEYKTFAALEIGQSFLKHVQRVIGRPRKLDYQHWRRSISRISFFCLDLIKEN